MRLILMLSAAAIAASAATADVANLNPSKDATIFDDGELAIGDGDLFIGTNLQFSTRRALLAFDLGSIPSGAVINSATLTLYGVQGFGDFTTGAHRVTTDWNEGPSIGFGGGGGIPSPAGATDATWTQTGLGGAWGAAGGDFIGAATDTTNLTFGDVNTFDVTADVQGFVDGTFDNFGWILISQIEGQTMNVWKLGGSENAQANFPVLTIDFIPTPSTAGLLALGGLVATRRRR